MKTPADSLRIVVMGVCGSGKTTIGQALAARLGLPFVEGDELHPPRNIELMAAGIALTDEDRVDWLEAIGRALAAASDTGVVLSCSALKRRYRDRLRAAAPGLRLLHLQGSPALLAQRLQARRGHYMPASLLRSQLETLEPPGADERALVLQVDLEPARIAAAAAAELQGVAS